MSMDNYIHIAGIELWLFVFFLLFISICLIALGVSYVQEVREKERWHIKYRNLCREYSYLQLNAETKGVKTNANRSEK